MANNQTDNFIQINSPDGGFLQSEHWWKFQESYGRKTHDVSASDDDGEPVAYANIITHTLPIVGDYFYIPRGPIINKIVNSKKQIYISKIKKFLDGLFILARKNRIGWIRVEPNSEEDLKLIKENLPSGIKIKKSPVDVQSGEILVVDISGNEGEILAQMKQKTRYNIRLAEKRGVKVKSIKYQVESIKYFGEFLRLIKITARRDKITPHPDEYYRKMFEMISDDVLKLYVAEYEGKVISANIVSFFGKVATYMHGASDYAYRDVMAPYLLQWQQILDAKKAGCVRYDFGGVKISRNMQHATHNMSSREGITKFKTGFAPEVEPIRFPGCWDIVLNPGKYSLYKILQKIKRLL
ncbi:MAG: hypothetical protein COZ28_01935 [Candidatus Moranbacteria bacterium CG_4_10_14_3_um_filter_44_15]|nr:MAG: hypothetical protein COS72_00415 [Candidatus Moranbacteria bacterium CG06_land_8_20_14_3_00_43_56]PIV83502.1 MAG: hypothetical protein COW51_04175 [Candidatus Moranbacteria bacterium CG17_big_fil_post_rev_8_21_14_2_50_44_12]PIW93372.1 MAG: hypothetical protein COZ87_01585 [Candidatus Moranbacteria bacterium CG_4_8_14_3_um_filter_43_15]PIX90781.1 MAG: hypothetical protein COZ28_01935 [Candidatus Moranbacteria bacterium CG_4_10_14_3_um_filter_44_15]PJA86367.1 MAG: hypothetical protein CO1